MTDYSSEIQKGPDCHESWISCKEKYPDEGKWVIMWRHRAKQYTVSKLENLPKTMTKGYIGIVNNENSCEYRKQWKSHGGNTLILDEKDFWRYFPLLSVLETYI